MTIRCHISRNLFVFSNSTVYFFFVFFFCVFASPAGSLTTILSLGELYFGGYILQIFVFLRQFILFLIRSRDVRTVFGFMLYSCISVSVLLHSYYSLTQMCIIKNLANSIETLTKFQQSSEKFSSTLPQLIKYICFIAKYYIIV